MSADNITKATLPAGGSASSTAGKFATAHEAHIHHHRGIIGKVESVTHGFTPRRRVHAGFSDKLESKHDKPLHLEFEAER